MSNKNQTRETSNPLVGSLKREPRYVTPLSFDGNTCMKSCDLCLKITNILYTLGTCRTCWSYSKMDFKRLCSAVLIIRSRSENPSERGGQGTFLIAPCLLHMPTPVGAPVGAATDSRQLLDSRVHGWTIHVQPGIL